MGGASACGDYKCNKLRLVTFVFTTWDLMRLALGRVQLVVFVQVSRGLRGEHCRINPRNTYRGHWAVASRLHLVTDVNTRSQL